MEQRCQRQRRGWRANGYRLTAMTEARAAVVLLMPRLLQRLRYVDGRGDDVEAARRRAVVRVIGRRDVPCLRTGVSAACRPGAMHRARE